MELLKWELRKIWRPGILAAILLLGAVYYWMFPQFYIEHFCNGPQSEAQFDLASDWVERYGPTLEPEERAELDEQMAEEITAFDTQITAIPEAAAAGLTDYKSFLSFRGDYLNGIRNTDGQADMDVEALLYRVYGGTNWYRIEALADTLETYDTQEEHRALIVSNRQQLAQPEAMVRREAELASSDMTHSLLPSSVKYSGGMVRTQHRAPALPHPGAGPAAEHPAHAVGLPAGAVRFERPDGSCPALCAGAGGGEYNSLCHSVPGPGVPAICRLRPGRHLGVGHSLVRLDLRHLSAGAGGADFGPVPGGRRADGFSLPVQRQLHRHAAEGRSPVRGGGGRAGLLASGSALHVPPPLGRLRPLGAQGCGGGGRRSPAGFGTWPVCPSLPAAAKEGTMIKEILFSLKFYLYKYDPDCDPER